jgi:hypothetical protein
VFKNAEAEVKEFTPRSAADSEWWSFLFSRDRSQERIGGHQRRATAAGIKRALRKKALPILESRVLPSQDSPERYSAGVSPA